MNEWMMGVIKSFLTVWLVWTLTGTVVAQVAPPRLILFLVVDELDNDQFLKLQSSFSGNGFNRLASEGFRFTSVTAPDFSAYPGTRLTTILSGVTPSVHGVVGEQWLDRRTGRITEPLALKPEAVHKSLQHSMSRTFPDYFKSIFGPGSRVGALSVNVPWMAHSLGYTPDYFYAYNRQNGVFYDVFQTGADTTWVNQFNIRYSTNGYLNRQWTPLKDSLAYSEYRFSTSAPTRRPFKSFGYEMNDGGIDGFKFGKVAASPFANTLLRDFTVAFLVNTQFGYDDTPDLLSVCFTTRPFVKSAGTNLPAEKEDMLLRLDAELASLIDFLDIDLGRHNYLIVLTAGATSGVDQTTHGSPGINTGILEPLKVTSLLNLYLMALHGQAKWVTGFHDGVVYLNHQVIQEKGLALKDVQESVSRFLLEVSGVAKAVPAHDLVLENRIDPLISGNIFGLRAGDVYVTLLPGWQTPVSPLGTRHDGFPGQRPVPFIFFGWQTNAGAWFENVKATYLIPMLMKGIGLSHPSEGLMPEVPVFNRPATTASQKP
jgi:hypothetical protein